MLNVHFVIVGAVIGLIGAVLYARDTVKGITHPNRVTWLLWGAIPMVTFAVELHAGVGLRSLMTFTIGFGPLVVLVASFVNRTSVWRIGPLDYACGGLSVAGTVVWVLTREGMVALVASIAADLLAGVPTLVKSWKAPQTESAIAYLTALVNAVITMLTVTVFTTYVVAFPLYIVAVAGVELALIAGRLGPRWRARRAPVGGAEVAGAAPG
jgi:hypothetical protein